MPNWTARFNARVQYFSRLYPSMKSQHIVVLAAHYTSQEKAQSDQSQTEERWTSKDKNFFEKLLETLGDGLQSASYESDLQKAYELAIQQDGGEVDTGLKKPSSL